MSNLYYNILILIIFISKSNGINLIININNLNNENYLRKLDLSNNNKTNSKEKITKSKTITCNIKNCEKCEKINKCVKCKNNYKLFDNHCYTTECKLFGFCDYCDEFDCLKCIKGYKLNFGTCDKAINSSKNILIFSILSPILIISVLIYLYFYIKNKNKNIIETGKVINLKHPKPGNYIIIPDTQREDQSTDNSLSKSSNLTHSNESTDDGDIKECIVCGKKKIYAFSDCGCGLCKHHWKYIKYNINEKITCRKHGTPLKSIVFSLENKSSLKGNAVERLGLKLCPICKINNGTQSFNCDCNMKLCEKCFNDNVYILKYNQCPGCGEPYNPNKDGKSGFKFGKKKIKEEKSDNGNLISDNDKSKSISYYNKK